jgi:hypothetical protein
MKITIEQYDHTITYEVDHDDVSMEQMIEIMENLLKCTGYRFDGNLEIVDDSEGYDADENWSNRLMKEMNDKQNERIMNLINSKQS